jgi:type IV secretion system T-DNA border endonuclease VirD2
VLEAHLSSLRTGRAGVLRQWAQTADRLDAQGERELAQAVRQFAASMPRALTDRQQMVDAVARALRDDRAEPKTPDVSKPRGQGVERN